MSDERDNDSEGSAGQTPDARDKVSASRRRFTRAGLSASAIMTLASRPALATRCSVSGMASINASVPGVTCMGSTAQEYLGSSAWHSMLSPDTKFNALSLDIDNMDVDLTVLQALGLGGVDLRREGTAGFLNAIILGEQVYGYNESSFRTFVSTSNAMDLYADLVELNSR